MKIKAIRNSLFLIGLLFLLGGCNTVFQDFTPEQIPENPSGIYTFSFSAEIPQGNRIAGTERAEITINNQTFPMVRSSSDDLTFTYDYKMPPGIKEARYYYTIYWDYSAAQGVKTAARYSTQEEEKVYHPPHQPLSHPVGQRSRSRWLPHSHCWERLFLPGCRCCWRRRGSDHHPLTQFT